MLDAVLADLGDVDQTFQVAFQAGKGTELGEAGDGTLDQLTDLELVNLALPGIALHGADGQTDAFLLAIDVDDLDLHFLTDLEHLRRVLDAFPGDLGQVHQTVGAVDVDEGAKIGQAGNLAGIDFTFLQGLDDAFLDGLAGFAGGGALGQDQPAALAVDFDDADRDRLADHAGVAGVGCVTGNAHAAGDAQLGGGHEAAQTVDGDDDTALVEAVDLAVKGRAFFEHLLDIRPALLFLGAGVREHHVAVVILARKHVDQDLLTDLQSGTFFGGDGFQLAAGDHAFRLGADADQDLGGPDAGYDASTDLPGLREIQRHAFLVEKAFHVIVVIVGVFGGVLALGRNPLPEWGVILFHGYEKLRRIR